ncbi:GNAT family N-acetyltransferase, partial [Candidatus Omnitrophota bacterium]
SRLRRKVGTRLLGHCIKEAGQLKLKKIFALTFVPGFFEKMGFKFIDKQDLPHKIWSECIKCVHFPDCSESALLKEL